MHELLLHCHEDAVQALSEALLEAGAVAVTVVDGQADTPGERHLFGEPGLPPPAAGWAQSDVQALFGDPDTALAAAACVRADPDLAAVQVRGLREVPEHDWVRLTQSQFEPIAITPGFWIVPTWHEPPAAARTMLRLDPGLAFGSGSHPTTRMCLRWIAAHAQAWSRVLDYGAGSGILALAAARHGATAIDAVDIDPAAWQSTLDNAHANSIGAPTVMLRAGGPELADGVYPLVLANILASPLKLLAPLLAGHVAPGGDLVLAGILERQADDLIEAYAPHVDLVVADREDGWILMTAHRAPMASSSRP